MSLSTGSNPTSMALFSSSSGPKTSRKRIILRSTIKISSLRDKLLTMPVLLRPFSLFCLMHPFPYNLTSRISMISPKNFLQRIEDLYSVILSQFANYIIVSAGLNLLYSSKISAKKRNRQTCITLLVTYLTKVHFMSWMASNLALYLSANTRIRQTGSNSQNNRFKAVSKSAATKSDSICLSSAKI